MNAVLLIIEGLLLCRFSIMVVNSQVYFTAFYNIRVNLDNAFHSMAMAVRDLSRPFAIII